MIEHPAHPGHPLHRRDRRRQFTRPQEEIVGKPVFVDRSKTPRDVVAQKPVWIRLVMDLMPDADEILPPRPLLQRPNVRLDIGRGQVDPGDHAKDDVRRLGQGKEFHRLGVAAPRLDEHRPRDARGTDDLAQVARVELPADHREIVGHPRVVGLRRVPDVMVGVDEAGHSAASVEPWMRCMIPSLTEA